MIGSSNNAKRFSVTQSATGGRRPSHRIGIHGQERVEVFDTEDAAGQALEVFAAVKRRRGYQDV